MKVVRAALLWLSLLSLAAIGVTTFSTVYSKYFAIYEYELPAYKDGSASVERDSGFPERKRVRILAIDGGGVWGLAELRVLMSLEKITGEQVHELFDFVAASSTGAIISSLLLMPEAKNMPPISAQAAISKYEQLASTVLDRSLFHTISSLNGYVAPRYQNGGRIKLARQLYGTVTFGELLLPTLYPGLQNDSESFHLFRNWKARDKTLLLSTLVTAVTSAEAFFPAIALTGYQPKTLVIGDPAPVLNSPTLVAYLASRELFPQADEFVIVTISTHFKAFIHRDLQVRGGIIDWLEPALGVARTSQAIGSQKALEVMMQQDSAVKIRNYLLSPDVSNTKAFEANEQNIRSIKHAAQEYVDKHSTLLSDVASELQK